MKPQGFSKSERLKKRSDYLATSREASNRLETGNFLVLLRPNELPVTRLGITVTKKIGKAVVRNRIKRHVREFFRLNKQLMPPGYDIVVIARRGAGGLTNKLVQNQLRILAERSFNRKR